MNRPTVSILLQNQRAWPLRIVGVILDNNGGPQPIDDIMDAYGVRGELVVAVERDTYFTPCH